MIVINRILDEDIAGIVEKRSNGMTYTDISKEYGVSRRTITQKLKKVNAYHNEPMIKSCEYCGNDFETNKYNNHIKRYCSDKCKCYSNKGKSMKFNNCFNCDKLYNQATANHKHCSKECAMRTEMLERNRRKKLKKCVYCAKWHSGLYSCCSILCTKRNTRRKNSIYSNQRMIRARQNGQFDADIDIYKLIERDGEQCYLCGDAVSFCSNPNDDKYPNIEHVIAISNGGTHSWDNVKVACRNCNLRKGVKMVDTILKGGITIG